jgi:hypothetical protein
MTPDLLAAEARAWRELPAPEYDAAAAALLDDAHDADAAAALVTAILGRPGEGLVQAAAAAAERMLDLAGVTADPEQRTRCLLLFLAGWLRLVDAAAAAPEQVESSPPLPGGVLLPTGADPAQIADPALRAEAESLAREHAAQAQRWNAGQAALGHLRRLAARAREQGPDALVLAMSRAPGLPPELGADA